MRNGLRKFTAAIAISLALTALTGGAGIAASEESASAEELHAVPSELVPNEEQYSNDSDDAQADVAADTSETPEPEHTQEPTAVPTEVPATATPAPVEREPAEMDAPEESPSPKPAETEKPADGPIPLPQPTQTAQEENAQPQPVYITINYLMPDESLIAEYQFELGTLVAPPDFTLELEEGFALVHWFDAEGDSLLRYEFNQPAEKSVSLMPLIVPADMLDDLLAYIDQNVVSPADPAPVESEEQEEPDDVPLNSKPVENWLVTPPEERPNQTDTLTEDTTTEQTASPEMPTEQTASPEPEPTEMPAPEGAPTETPEEDSAPAELFAEDPASSDVLDTITEVDEPERLIPPFVVDIGSNAAGFVAFGETVTMNAIVSGIDLSQYEYDAVWYYDAGGGWQPDGDGLTHSYVMAMNSYKWKWKVEVTVR